MFLGFSFQIFHFLLSHLPVFISVWNLFCIVHKHINLPRWSDFFYDIYQIFFKKCQKFRIICSQRFFYIKKVWSPRKYFWLFQIINKVFGSFLIKTDQGSITSHPAPITKLCHIKKQAWKAFRPKGKLRAKNITMHSMQG